MKTFNKISLRMRITILSGTILLAVSLLLTFMSMYNAQNSVVTPLTNIIAYLTVDGKEMTGADSVDYSTFRMEGFDKAETNRVSNRGVSSITAAPSTQAKIGTTRMRNGIRDNSNTGLRSVYNLRPSVKKYENMYKVLEGNDHIAVNFMEERRGEKKDGMSNSSGREFQIPEMPQARVNANVMVATASQIAFTAKKNFNLFSFWSVLLISILGMILIYLISGMAMKPVTVLTKAAEEISGDQLKKRIPASDSKDEISKLTKSFNGMLDRLEASFNNQKQFSSNVAHELKTPLATIQAGIQVLHLDSAPSRADYEEVLHLTQTNVTRLMNIVDDLMAMCNDRAGDYSDEIQLKRVFRDIFSELEPTLKEKGIQTELDCQAVTVKGNYILMYRALFNLVENAVKYNEAGGRIIVRTAFSEDEEVGEIIIADTGIGIPEEEMNHIFEPFYRVEKSRNRKIGGAGLGLALVKTILEKHGWQIAVESRVDEGTRFILTTPVFKD